MLKRMAHFLTLKQLVATSAVLVTCACDRIEPAFAPAEAEVKNVEIDGNPDFDGTLKPVDPTRHIADAEFISPRFYPNIENNEPNYNYIGKHFWYIEDEQALTGDVVRHIKYCDDDDFLICILSPVPIFLPKSFSTTHAFTYKQQSFSIEASDHFQKALTCNYEIVEFEVTDRNSKSYRYVISKDAGVLNYSTTFADGHADRLYKISGTIFPYQPKCN